MKVLHFYKAYLPDSKGGVEQSINQLARSGSSFGVDVEVLTLSLNEKKNSIKLDNHLVHNCLTNFEIASTPFSLSAFFRLKELIKAADIIHYHFPYPFADILHFIARVKKPSVLTYHSDIVQQKYLYKIYHPLMNKFLKSVDHIVATSPNYLKTSKVLTRFKEKVSVIPIGLDKSSYPIPSKSNLVYWRKKFRNKFFLFVGVMRYYKGLHILIEAASKSDYPIVIVGSGPIERELKLKVKKEGVNNIHFVGFVSDLDKVSLFTLSYAIVFPSHLRSEAFGISLLEGAMHGKPLISSEIGTGTTYININGETGLVVEPSNPKALHKAMEYLWKNPNIAKKMGEGAAKRFDSYFTANKNAESYHNLYISLLNESNKI
ncbi:glycosyltransferase family 4 protein [Methylophilaceae bacterium]|nr:glycosyltransferase family 4 protein [Methylophilaceae bacterium]